MKKTFLATLVVTLVMALVMMPGAGLASTTAQGIAQMSWNINCPTCGPTPPFPSVNWLDAGSFSSAAVNLNGVFEEDFSSVDGAPWALTGLSKTLADGTGSASGQGYTTPDLGVQEAISEISLSGDSYASVDIAQGVLSGQFTVSTATPLNILADYLLQMSLFNSNIGESSYVDVSVGLSLSNFVTGAEYASASRFFPLSLVDAGSSSFFLNFQDPTYASLQLTYDLVPGIIYDFEAQASTVAYATSVPEPMSLILLASGLGGLAIFRKRFA